MRVVTDYDSSANFDSYTSFAFSKQEINKLEISDIDKKRILSSIEQSMNLKGYNFSNSPDLIVNISTKSKRTYMSTDLMIITFMVGVPTHIHNHTVLQVESLVCYILIL